MRDQGKTKKELIREVAQLRQRVSDLEALEADRKQAEEALEKRIAALTRPIEDTESIAFEDLFNLSDLQRLQDLFAEIWGVAALITRPDGTPITQPSHFTYLCSEFIRKTEKGFSNCQKSDAMLGRHNPSGPTIHTCLSAGLCGAGASMTVGGRHIANWLIGQVRNETQSEEQIMKYAREIGADETAFREAFLKVPVMPQEKFEKIAHALFALANQLSNTAFQNVQQARFIAERRQTEEALHKSEQKYRRLHESMTEAFAMVDMNGRIQETNRAYQSMLGYSEEELRRLTYSDITPEKWHALEKRIVEEKILVQGRADVYEKEYRRKDGTVIPVELGTFLIRDDAGKPAGMWAIVRDITERKRIEEELKATKDYLRTVFNNVYDAILIHDLDGRVKDVNDKWLEMYGVSREEAIELDVLRDLSVTDESKEESLSNWKKIMSGENLFVEWKARRPKDGSVFDVEVFLTRLLLPGGNFILANVRDITKRKRAEEEMRRLRNYLGNIINSMPSVLVGVDREGRVTQWNQVAEQLTGLKAEEAQGEPLEKVFPTLSREIGKVQQAIRDKTVQSENRVPRVVRGETRYEDVTVYPLVTNGVEGVVIRIDDVTDRARIEEMMIQSEKMLSVGGLAAGMAHEINNPLGVILQAAQNVTRRVSSELEANVRVAKACGTTLSAVRQYLEQREVLLFLEDIRRSGQRAAQIVENMLSFSRKPEAGGSSTDLRELLDQTVELAGSDYNLKKQYDFRQIQIAREYDPNVPPVICQASKIQQVFLNILRNGAEAMWENKVSGRTPRFFLRLMREGTMVRVEIEDNGPGMDDATRRRVFEPFFSTKSPGMGTGLGLSVSYFIITEDHGGTISVESAPGEGARFIIRLPG